MKLITTNLAALMIGLLLAGLLGGTKPAPVNPDLPLFSQHYKLLKKRMTVGLDCAEFKQYDKLEVSLAGKDF